MPSGGLADFLPEYTGKNCVRLMAARRARALTENLNPRLSATQARRSGNIRELQNVVERAVIMSEGETFFVDEAGLRA
jgi:DNA-binding NtrC family response regulator